MSRARGYTTPLTSKTLCAPSLTRQHHACWDLKHMYMYNHVGEFLLSITAAACKPFIPHENAPASCMTLTQIMLCVGLGSRLLRVVNCFSCWVWRCLLLTKCLTDLDTSLRWWGLRDNQACRSRSVGRWWGYGTAHTHSRSHKCCGRYTGRLKEWKERRLNPLSASVNKHSMLFHYIYFTIGLNSVERCWANKEKLYVIMCSHQGTG